MIVLYGIAIMLVGLIGLSVLIAYGLWCFLSVIYLREWYEAFQDEEERPQYREFIKECLRELDSDEIMIGLIATAATHVVVFGIGVIILAPFIFKPE